MGVAVAGEVTEGYYTRLSGRLRAEHHREETSCLCTFESRSEGQNEADRLPQAGG